VVLRSGWWQTLARIGYRAQNMLFKEKVVLANCDSVRALATAGRRTGKQF